MPVLILLSCGPAAAFSGWEHETISQASLLVASNYVSVTLGGLTNGGHRLATLRETVSTFYHGLPETAEWRKPKSVPITYGEISMLADYMKDTYDMLHLPHSKVTLPVDASTSNLPFLRSLLDHGDKVISLASASHDAYNHFQGRMVDAFYSHHKLAVAAAAENNLWGALLLSAYANHFLEDIFASGHVLAPRDANAHDLDVALLHDSFNKEGLSYVIEAPHQVTNLAYSARAFLGPVTNTWKSQDRRPKHVVSITPQAINTFCDRLAAQPRVEVFCRGDDRIMSHEQQPVLMMVYCARAAADVLESYLRGKPVNSFPSFVWDRRTFKPLAGVELIEMRLPYGALSCSNHPPEYQLFKAAQKTAPPDDSLTNFNVMVSLTRPIYRNPGLALTLGFETVSDFEGSSVRALLEGEALVTGGRGTTSRDTDQFKERKFPATMWPRSWGLTLGYSGIYNTHDTGHGGFARVVWPIAPLNLQVSFQVGCRYYWGDGADGVRDFEMVRADWGLHILTIFVGVGRDYYSRHNEGLFSGLAFEAGLSIALPYSKFKTIGSMAE